MVVGRVGAAGEGEIFGTFHQVKDSVQMNQCQSVLDPNRTELC